MPTTPVHQKVDIFTRSEGAALKGVGILLIATHNLAHCLGATGYDCNEFNFEQESSDALFHFLLHPGQSILIQLSTLLGYCGIYAFLFISAFGLVRKYEQGTTKMPAPHIFVWQHYTKLFKLMFFALISAILAVWYVNSSKLPSINDCVAQALMVTNWLKPPYSHVFPGPYWFFGLMIELYIIYRLVLYVPRDGAAWRKWMLPLLFIAATVTPQILLRNAGREMIYMRYNFFVAGLTFSAGLLVARYGGIPRMGKWAWAGVFAVASVAFILMQATPVTWILSSLVVTVAMIALVKTFSATVMRPFVWVGGISSFLFVIHPVIRTFALYFGNGISNHLLVLIYTIVAILAAVAYRRFLTAIHWK